MKNVDFKLYGKKITVVLSKDILTRLIGFLFIIISTGLLGVFEFFKWGWDWSMLSNNEFWSGYFIKLMTLYVAFFGAYLIKRSVNLNNQKIVIQKATLRENKKLISKHFKTSHCETWIEKVKNYSNKLELYRDYLDSKNSRLNLIEPKEPDKDCKCYKLKLFFYHIQKKRYDNGVVLRSKYEEQLTLVEKHIEVINLYRKNDFKGAKQLYKSFEKEDMFKYFMPGYKGLNYQKLFNVTMEGQHFNSKTIEYKEFSTITKKIVITIGIGCILLAFITSIVLDLTKTINYMTFVYIALNILLMLWYVLNGILTANKFVFGNVLNADAERIKICNEYRDDCIALQEDWAKDLKSETDEKEGE